MARRLHLGGCHCGAVRYEAHLDLDGMVSRCNCRMCTMLACSNAVAKPEEFRVTAGEEHLKLYRRGEHPMQYFFCADCGVHLFVRGDIPEMGGKIVSVHVNTLDGFDPARQAHVHWDGRHDNWHAGPRPTPWPVHAAG